MKGTSSRQGVQAVFALAFMLGLGTAHAQSPKVTAADLIDFKAEVLAADPFSPLNQVGTAKQEFRRGEAVRLVITATLKRPDAYTYPMAAHAALKNADIVNSIKYGDNAGFQPLLPISEPEPEIHTEPGLAPKLVHTKSPIVYSQDILILPSAAPGTQTLKFTIKGQVCNSKTCIPFREPFGVFALPVTVSNAAPLPLTPELEARLKEAQKPATPPEVGVKVAPVPAGEKIVPMSETADAHKADLEAVLRNLESQQKAQGTSGLLAFMLAGVFWGAISLITPCVFPMIPITVSFFLKQSEKEHHRPLFMASIYCGTIVVVLTIAAVALLSFFRELSVHPIMNYALGALFVFFALSLFGMYEIELPSGLARYTSAREGQGGVAGTMFMALTFTIVSFACVAPFLGGFGGTSAGSGITWLHRILGGFAFAATFASPFFVLALFPSLLKKMPKSGSWLNSVKVVMGFLELAAALKFLRAGELLSEPKPVFFTYDLVLGLWIAMSLLCGLYLLNFYRLPHDSQLEHIGVLRMLFGLAFIALGFYMLPAQFKLNASGESQRPNGKVYAWIDSFLLPEPLDKGDLAWSGNLKQVLDQARAEAQKTGQRRLVFVDFTGESCTNCKLNEKDVFSKPDIQKLFDKYALVQLYTDKVPDKFYAPELRGRFGGSVSRQKQDAEANLWFQKAAFDTEQLPLYVILEARADGKIEVLGQYDEGKISNDAAFAQFLKGPLENATTATAQLSGR